MVSMSTTNHNHTVEGSGRIEQCIPEYILSASKGADSKGLYDSLTQIVVTPKELYALLSKVLNEEQPLFLRHRMLREVFHLAIGQQLSGVPLTFCGLFQKLDYIIRHKSIPKSLADQIYALNRRLSQTVSGRQTTNHVTEKAGTAVCVRKKKQFSPLAYDVKVVAETIAALYEEDVPETLQLLLPTDYPCVEWSRLDTHQLRVIVDNWDDEYIYCHTEALPDELKVCYSPSNRYLYHEASAERRDEGIDWTYLRLLLTQGCQLNLVYIRHRSDVLFPEVIIYEPDLLIDITSVTRCFAPYTDSPWVALLAVLGQSHPTIHTELGNLASQFLDETINRQEISYANSLSRFFVTNAFKLATIEDLGKTDFHSLAQRQKQHIAQLIGEDLPRSVSAYDPTKVVVEPSFVCPTLGLQGRMDMLQFDYKVLLEQKSGKGAFTPTVSGKSTDDTPTPVETHILQLLLYRAVLHYGFRRSAKSIVGIFLLYSKYKHGLVSLSSNPRLLCRGIKARNQMAWAEQFYAKGGLNHLLRLTPETLNTKKDFGRFWQHYLRPQISAVLNPLQQADTVAQTYVIRMLTFVWREKLQSTLGNHSKDTSGHSSLWQDTFDDKLRSGNILAPMLISEVSDDKGIITGLRLGYTSEYDFKSSNFRRGDIVIIYSYATSTIPSPCNGIVYRCIIDNIDNHGIIVKLRDPQRNSRVFGCRRHKSGKIIPIRQSTKSWAVEHDHADSSTALVRGLFSILTTSPERRSLILTQREPRVNPTYTLKGDYGNFNQLVTKSMQARDYFLLIGPPGTGKTSFGLMSILREELLNPSSAVLLCAYTNRAVDEICSKLVDAGLDFLRMGPEQSCAEPYRSHLVSKRLGETQTLQGARQLLSYSKIICATTTTLARQTELFSLKHFSLAIVDEASQILEPHIVGILSSCQTSGQPAIDRFVLIGDHKQLPAVTKQSSEDSVVSEELLHKIGLFDCKESLFERLLRRSKHIQDIVYMLKSQGRMHPDIAAFPSRMFYGGQLSAVPLPHQLSKHWPEHSTHKPQCKVPQVSQILQEQRRLTFIDVLPTIDDMRYDKSNLSEARIIAEIVYNIYKEDECAFVPDFTIGIIVPYRNQIAIVLEALAKYKIPALCEITIDTVERYQGSQREVIIYGFTVTKPQQLNFLTSQTFVEDGVTIDRKLNVALTRARQRLYLVGNRQLLSRVPLFRQLIDHALS